MVSEKVAIEFSKSLIVLIFIVAAVITHMNSPNRGQDALFKLGGFGVIAYISISLFIDGVYFAAKGAMDDPAQGNEDMALAKSSLTLNLVIGILLLIFFLGVGFSKIFKAGRMGWNGSPLSRFRTFFGKKRRRR